MIMQTVLRLQDGDGDTRTIACANCKSATTFICFRFTEIAMFV
jgi:hypothetical protein